ncbi:hypothetical protein A2U01_0046671, partial [Trifolium medium]|nr:hypothetical protein [Trifolium medium]
KHFSFQHRRNSVTLTAPPPHLVEPLCPRIHKSQTKIEGFSICYWRQMTKNKAIAAAASSRVMGLHGGSKGVEF